jgi:hypothetical protein
MNPQKRRLGRNQRRALEILADTGPRGVTEAALLVQGFRTSMLAGLVRDGLAMVVTEPVRAGGQTIEVVRIRITDSGRTALG